MSFAVHFSFSWCLSKALTVPAGTKSHALEHVNAVERTLGLKQVPPGEETIEAYGPLYPAHWDYLRSPPMIAGHFRCGASRNVRQFIVAGGMESLRFSQSWLNRCCYGARLLLAVQDGMDPRQVGTLLDRVPGLGIFLGGSTEYKLQSMYGWGVVAAAAQRYYHVGRVNSARRIQLCEEAGAHSFDGTSVTRYAKSLPRLDASRRQPRLFGARTTS